eukprot:2240848-Rhodomonas_salina.1
MQIAQATWQCNIAKIVDHVSPPRIRPGHDAQMVQRGNDPGKMRFGTWTRERGRAAHTLYEGLCISALQRSRCSQSRGSSPTYPAARSPFHSTLVNASSIKIPQQPVKGCIQILAHCT